MYVFKRCGNLPSAEESVIASEAKQSPRGMSQIASSSQMSTRDYCARCNALLKCIAPGLDGITPIVKFRFANL